MDCTSILIDPNLIQWIRWAESHIDDQEGIENYRKIAVSIPKVEEQLKEGESLTILAMRDDPVGTCVRTYYLETELEAYTFIHSFVLASCDIVPLQKAVAALRARVMLPVHLKGEYQNRKKEVKRLEKKKGIRGRYGDFFIRTRKVLLNIGKRLELYVNQFDLEYDPKWECWRLNDQQKEEVAQIYYEELSKLDDNANVYAIIKEKVFGIQLKGDKYLLKSNWKMNSETMGKLDGAVKGSRKMTVIRAGQMIDRTGAGDGKYFSPLNEIGIPYSLKERAVGGIIENGESLEEDTCYHRYIVLRDFDRENIKNAIEMSPYIENARLRLYVKLDNYYRDCLREDDSCEHPGEAYGKTDSDGIKTGLIDSMFLKDDGGAVQYIMPFTAKQLEILEMIREVYD